QATHNTARQSCVSAAHSGPPAESPKSPVLPHPKSSESSARTPHSILRKANANLSRRRGGPIQQPTSGVSWDVSSHDTRRHLNAFHLILWSISTSTANPLQTEEFCR